MRATDLHPFFPMLASSLPYRTMLAGRLSVPATDLLVLAQEVDAEREEVCVTVRGLGATRELLCVTDGIL